ncbi:AcrR family transcriptional regulator [Novosphingobium capsulatum]|uniref:AcrR family transcriptional regulator n=1 Tax=Novosphingobium capsulatum TaxID=13688 RepID=A0ABU1MNM8_9SPHN|nr:TetR/AcrR family transcriptional regulator [Novosphingobium capsulatum]MDR6511950.1 AcrR family transcriptional regulator [Novosphingobium capsulatum]
MPAPVDHAAKRKAIARISAELIAERGLQAATIRQVAARAGFSTTVVTHYFANKRALLLAAYRYVAERTQQRFDAMAADDESEPLSRLEILLPLDAEGRNAWRLYFQFWPMADHDEELAEEQRWWSDNARSLARAMLELARPDLVDIDRKATLALSALHGIAMQALFDPDNWPASRQQEVWRTQAQLLSANAMA